MDRNDPKSRYFARTMHTPDDPVRAELRSTLRELSKTLIPLHRSLIEAARSDYAFAHAPVESPNQLLQLLQTDPFFEWLRPITALIVDIDEMTRTDFDRAAVDSIAKRTERLFGGAEGEFAGKYIPILQRDVDVAGGHAAVKRVLARLQS
jgi:hypothetical protein